MAENIFAKLQKGRVELQRRGVQETGKNIFAKYDYLELRDFLPAVQEICGVIGICGVVRFSDSIATLTLVNTENPEEMIVFSSPMATAELKGCHPVQNLGAAQTYLRRYLWIAAFEVVECDAVDAGRVQPTQDASGTTATKLVSTKQVGMFQKEFVARGVNKDKFLAVAGVKDLSEIEATRFDALMAQVKLKPLLKDLKLAPPNKTEETPATTGGQVVCRCPEAAGMDVPFADCSTGDCHNGCPEWARVNGGVK